MSCAERSWVPWIECVAARRRDCVCVRAYVCVYVYTCAHTHTHTYVHTRTRLRAATHWPTPPSRSHPPQSQSLSENATRRETRRLKLCHPDVNRGKNESTRGQPSASSAIAAKQLGNSYSIASREQAPDLDRPRRRCGRGQRASGLGIDATALLSTRPSVRADAGCDGLPY